MAVIHFLNVGHGDCTIIQHNDGKLTVIDINNGSTDMDDESVKEIVEASENSQSLLLLENLWKSGLYSEASLLKAAGYQIGLTNPISYLNTRLPTATIFRYIQTHPDLDHMRGLADLAEGRDIVNFWDVPNSKPWGGSELRKGDKRDWDAYKELGSGTYPKVMHLTRGSKGKYFNEGDETQMCHGISILSPTSVHSKNCDEIEDWNGMSYVLKYQTGGKTIIFGGDAEDSAWENIVANYDEKDLKCDILKASHHGRDNGYFQEAVKIMAPDYTIVSVGKKPDTDASNKYKQYSKNVWSTRWYGDLRATIKDGNITWECSNS